MKAFVITAPNEYGMKDIDMPEIGPEEVLLKTLASGICHSDYDLMAGQLYITADVPDYSWP